MILTNRDKAQLLAASILNTVKHRRKTLDEVYANGEEEKIKMVLTEIIEEMLNKFEAEEQNLRNGEEVGIGV